MVKKVSEKINEPTSDELLERKSDALKLQSVYMGKNKPPIYTGYKVFRKKL